MAVNAVMIKTSLNRVFLGRSKNVKRVFRITHLSTALLLIFLGLVAGGCGPKGPAVTDCTPQTNLNTFICFNEANGKTTVARPSQVDNWIFVSASDERSIQTACANSTGWPKITVCSFSANQMKYVCYNEVSQKSFVLQFADSSGWIGVSAVDEQILLEFCAYLAQKKKIK